MKESSPSSQRSVAKKEFGETSLEERSVVERIEKLKTSDDTKALIILIWKGLKPGGEFDLADYDTENEIGRAEQITEAEKLFTDLKLFSHRIQKEIDITRYDPKGNKTAGKFYRDRYYLAQNKNDLQYTVDHFGKKESDKITKKLGTIFGYPASAIEAWNVKDRSTTILDTERKQPELYARGEMAFSHFRLSKTNWQQEFDVIKKWADEVKRLAPTVYANIIQRYQHSLLKQEGSWRKKHEGH